MSPELVSVFQSLLVAVVVALVGLITFAAKKAVSLAELYLEQKMGQVSFSFLKDYVTTTVRFLEQSPVVKDMTGPEKKDEAIADVVAWCRSKAIPVDRALIEKMIEEAVNIMNGVAVPPLPPLIIQTMVPAEPVVQTPKVVPVVQTPKVVKPKVS